MLSLNFNTLLSVRIKCIYTYHRLLFTNELNRYLNALIFMWSLENVFEKYNTFYEICILSSYILIITHTKTIENKPN